MNDNILTQLKILVEQAVRPVQATRSRKLQMREELLSHLTAIYEEELETQRDEQVAFERAKQRFGNPAELSQELQNSVSWWNRMGGLQQHKMRFESGESSLHFAAKHTFVTIQLTIILYSIFVPLGIFVRVAVHKPPEIATILRIVLATSVVSALFTFALLFLGAKACRALSRVDGGRSHRTTVLCCLVSLPLLPMLVFFIYGSLWLPVPIPRLLVACLIAPAMPVLILLMGHVMADEIRSDEEWARIEIDN